LCPAFITLVFPDAGVIIILDDGVRGRKSEIIWRPVRKRFTARKSGFLLRHAPHSKKASKFQTCANDVLVGISTTVIAGCAINPQTGQPEFSQSVKTEFKSVFDNPDPCSNNDRNIAAVSGAVAGAVIGHYVGKNVASTMVGTGIGLLLGGMIGHAMDERRCNLYHIAQQYQMKLASEPIKAGSVNAANDEGVSAGDIVGLDVQMGGVDDEFLPGTARLTPRAKEYRPKEMFA
jgi:hypothetical protein